MLAVVPWWGDCVADVVLRVWAIVDRQMDRMGYVNDEEDVDGSSLEALRIWFLRDFGCGFNSQSCTCWHFQ